jgi:hypothetical protein
MKRYLFNILSITALIFFIISSCDSPEPEPEPTDYVNPKITFYSSGTWSASKHLEISQDKRAVLLSSYPELELKLTDEEYSDILTAFNGFSTISVNNEIICFDSIVFTISISENGVTEEKTFDGCYLGAESTEKPEVKEMLLDIVISLDQLADSIYQTKAPWRGLNVQFSLNKEVYNVGEAIEAGYIIHNPTDKIRELWFEHEYPIYFRANSYSNEGEKFYYEYPTRNQTRDSEPTKIILKPRETRSMAFTWDQTVENDGGIQVPLNQYMITLRLSIFDFGISQTVIQIVDK